MHMKKITTIKKFFGKYDFSGVTLGFLVAHSASKFIESIINGFVMAFFQPLLGDVHWRDDVITLGVFSFKWGEIFSTGLHFTIILLIVVFMIKVLQYDEEQQQE